MLPIDLPPSPLLILLGAPPGSEIATPTFGGEPILCLTVSGGLAPTPHWDVRGESSIPGCRQTPSMGSGVNAPDSHPSSRDAPIQPYLLWGPPDLRSGLRAEVQEDGWSLMTVKRSRKPRRPARPGPCGAITASQAPMACETWPLWAIHGLASLGGLRDLAPVGLPPPLAGLAPVNLTPWTLPVVSTELPCGCSAGTVAAP